MISVVIPIYNVEKFLRKCVDSVLLQTYADIEVILVDDGSTDTCPEIIDEYSRTDKRVKALHKTNGGLVSARQYGLQKASGEYVMYVDGDDWIARDCLKVLFDAASMYDVDLVCCSTLVYFKNKVEKKIIPYRSGLYKKEQLRSEIYPTLVQGPKANNFSPNAWGKLYKRDALVIHQMNVDSRIVMGEDFALTKPYVASIASMFVVDACLYCYNNLNSESLTHAKKCLSWDDPELIECALRHHMSSTDYDFRKQIDRYYVHLLFHVAVSRFNSKKNFFQISRELFDHLSKQNVHRIIKRANFSCWKGTFAKLSLQYRLIPLIYLYWIKKFK